MELEHESTDYWKEIGVWIVIYIIILTVLSIFVLPYFFPFGMIAWFLVFIFGTYMLIMWHYENTAFVCPNCNYLFTTTLAKHTFSPNKFTEKYLKCPNCDKRVWCKGVLKKPVEHLIGTTLPQNKMKKK